MPRTGTTFQVRLLIGLITTSLFVLLLQLSPAPLNLIESKLYDLRVKMRTSPKAPDTVVIAAIDEKSIERLGRWPWDRDVMARLVHKLARADASVIAIDVIFSEREKNDRLLARAMEAADNVILPVVFDFSASGPGNDDPSLESSSIQSVTTPGRFDDFPPVTGKKVLLPVPELRRQAVSLGHINMFPDSDGTLRWESLLIAYQDRLYPSLPLLAAARHLGLGIENITVDAARSINAGKAIIPTDNWGRTLINYYGPSHSFRHIPICDILDGTASPELLANRIVLIGATAVGIYDLRVTPYSPAMPGVEKHASVIASILENRFIRKADQRMDLAIVIISGLLLTFLLTGARVLTASIATAAFVAAITASAMLLFTKTGLWINLSIPVFNLVGIYTVITAYNYWAEERFSRNIRRMFSNYVTARVVNELIKNPQMAKLGGERRVVTVLFSDIKGFTAFSEKHSPTEVVTVLNEYLGAMTEVIFKWEGTLDKFVGDEIMVFWGAPMLQDRHAELAVRCALDMGRRLGELQRKWTAEGKPALDAGIGINSGEVLVGNIGAEGKKMDYTVIGDHVNLGARVEALTRKYERPILLTEYTLSLLSGPIEEGRLNGISFEGLGRVVVKGKQQPVALYTAQRLDDQNAAVSITECDDGQISIMTEK